MWNYLSLFKENKMILGEQLINMIIAPEKNPDTYELKSLT